jgi:hypothetical protein
MTLDASYPAWKLCCLMQVLTWHVSPSSFFSLSHIYAISMACATGPGMNRTLKIDLNSEKITFNFKLVSSGENYSKFNVSSTLVLKIMKSP